MEKLFAWLSGLALFVVKLAELRELIERDKRRAEAEQRAAMEHARLLARLDRIAEALERLAPELPNETQEEREERLLRIVANAQNRPNR